MNNRISHTRATIIKTALSNTERGITVMTRNEHWTDKDFHLGVNWAALGTEDPEETIRFATELAEIAKVVGRINDLNLIEESGIENEIKSEDDYDKVYEGLTRLIELREYDLFIDYVKRSAR